MTEVGSFEGTRCGPVCLQGMKSSASGWSLSAARPQVVERVRAMRLNGPRNKMYGISANRVAVNSNSSG